LPQFPIYLDNHSTTRVDPRVVEAMIPYFSEVFGNAGSTTHRLGQAAKTAVDAARQKIAAGLHAAAREIVFTSGATESNNLAIRGVAERLSAKGRHIISLTTEHPSVLEPLEKLAGRGFKITLLPVTQAGSKKSGLVEPERVAETIRPDTILISVMLANNEIGAIQPLAEIGRLCKERGVLLHSDATQAVGKIKVDVEHLQVDLMSFSAHKIYGPKGIGALYVRKTGPRVKLDSQIDGGGQEFGTRSGTLNVPGIVGFAKALELCLSDLPVEQERLRTMRNRLFEGITGGVPGVSLNGPAIEISPLRSPTGAARSQVDWSAGTTKCSGPASISSPLPLGEGPGVRAECRLAGNLNLSFGQVDGETLLIKMPEIALSSGSACSSATPEPSRVLRALGVSTETARGSIRFGLGRFNTPEEVEYVIPRVIETVAELRKMIDLA
jgi:cysteine desulfurase